MDADARAGLASAPTDADVFFLIGFVGPVGLNGLTLIYETSE